MIGPGRPSASSDASILSRFRLGLQSLITAHPSVEGWGQRNRAQFLALLSLSTIFLSLVGALVGRNTFGIFLMLAGFSLIAYFLSRTRYYYVGTYVFVYSLASIAFIRIYQGSTTSVDAAISTSVHISLVVEP
jgi:cellulose synthase/poly-beta-1,6-N-acetylglucosamine synthase-like glycosyltransferase